MRPASLIERPTCMEIIKVHMRDLHVRPAPPAGSGTHAKPNQVLISKLTGATKIRPYSHHQVPKIITVVQKRIVEIHFMIPFLTQNFPQQVTISKSIMIDWFILYDKIKTPSCPQSHRAHPISPVPPAYHPNPPRLKNQA